MVKVKISDKKELLIDLHLTICENSNAYISIEIDRLCRKFIKDLEECYFQP